MGRRHLQPVPDRSSCSCPRIRIREENYETILKAIESNGIVADEAEDIRNGRSSVREMWYSLNQAAIIIADLTGSDAGVMYGLGHRSHYRKGDHLDPPERLKIPNGHSQNS